MHCATVKNKQYPIGNEWMGAMLFANGQLAIGLDVLWKCDICSLHRIWLTSQITYMEVYTCADSNGIQFYPMLMEQRFGHGIQYI